jgi:hypothetical protein
LGAEDTIQGKDVPGEKDGIRRIDFRDKMNFGMNTDHSDMAPSKRAAWIVENTGSPYGEHIPLYENKRDPHSLMNHGSRLRIRRLAMIGKRAGSPFTILIFAP